MERFYGTHTILFLGHPIENNDDWYSVARGRKDGCIENENGSSIRFMFHRTEAMLEVR